MNETENNNLRTNADLISDNDTVTGILSSRNDVDCFKVNFTNNGSVTFRLTIPSDVDYRIRIFDGVENDEHASVRTSVLVILELQEPLLL